MRILAAIALSLILHQSTLRADSDADCRDGCLRLAQYPYNYNQMTPEQQYQERQRQYREEWQRNNEQYERQKREFEQGRSRASNFGAIAYSPDTRDYGYSFGYSSRSEAERRAKRECGKDDCEIAAWFENSCGAVAVGDDGTWAGGTGNTERAARQDAMTDCTSDGGKNCKVLYSRCAR
jgi:serine/threonine-protein kinase